MNNMGHVNILWLVQTPQRRTEEQEPDSQMLSIVEALIMA